MIDWNASAAWIALIVSVVGTVFGPLFTALINNHHQREMFDLQQSAVKNAEREKIVRAAISSSASVVANGTLQDQAEFGRTFYAAYSFVSSEHWSTLDGFFFDITLGRHDSACDKLSTIESLFLSSIQKGSK